MYIPLPLYDRVPFISSQLSALIKNTPIAKKKKLKALSILVLALVYKNDILRVSRHLLYGVAAMIPKLNILITEKLTKAAANSTLNLYLMKQMIS